VTKVQKVEIKSPCYSTSGGALSLFYFKAIKGACKESNNVLFDLPLKLYKEERSCICTGGLVFVEAGKQKKKTLRTRTRSNNQASLNPLMMEGSGFTLGSLSSAETQMGFSGGENPLNDMSAR